MDVYISPAAAFSSLGWFNDPLLSTMFSGSEIRLAAFLFHELAHQRLYLKDDGLFNEGYASFVEETGVRAWLTSSQRQNDLLHWQQLQDANRDFTELIGKVRTELSDVYQSNETVVRKRQLKADIFRSLSNSYKRLSEEKWHGKRYYSTWFEPPLNNAKLALYNTYESSHCAFKGLLDTAGGNLREFHRLAEQKSRLQKDDREKWLKQKCLNIAPKDDL
jgi:predicted aminopeptidase